MAEYTFRAKFEEFHILYRGVVRVWMDNGILYAEYLDGVIQELGPASSYAIAVEHGYEGTEEEWEELIANSTQNLEQAVEAKTDAESARDAAITAKEEAVTAKGQAESARDIAVSSKTAAEAAQAASETAQTNAETAEANAQEAQRKAEIAQAAAESVQTSVFNARDEAIEAKDSAIEAQTATESSQAAAELSEQNAASSASNALESSHDSEAWAVGKRGGVAVEVSDITYENNSKYYHDQTQIAYENVQALEQSTVSSEANAAASASAAAQSASNADTSEVNARTSETNASASAAAALLSEQNAATSNETAAKWATGNTIGTPTATNNAKYYSEQAATSEANALSSKNSAAASATSANTSKTAAQAAQAAAQTAQTAAESAKTDAINAKTSAQSAQTAADNSASNAATSMNEANTAKNAAQEYSLKSEAWAAGTRNGSNIPTTDDAYHNNSKYFATQASVSANSASTSETNAASSASSASASATSAQTSAENAAASAASIRAATTSTTYQNSLDGVNHPSDEPANLWTAEPNPVSGQFTWARTIITWLNNQVSKVYNVSYIGANGTGSVDSVNGKGGVVTLLGSDIAVSANNTTRISTELDNKLNVSLKGVAGGLAELDNSGKIPSTQLPSYVDDVLEFASRNNFPVSGESGKIYVAIDTNLTYRWTGSQYATISSSLTLGETASTAYRGDRGATAYAHASNKGSAFASGLYKITTNAEGHVTGASAVTKADIIGLGIPGEDTDTKNTAGSTNTTDKLYLIGAGAQAGSGQTFSNVNVYTQNGAVYSEGMKVLVEHQDISGKSDKTTTVTNVSYDTTNHKLTKTINGVASDIVSIATIKQDLSLAKSDVGLSYVDNTSDADKPISSATQTALNLKLDASSVITAEQINGLFE